MMLVAGDICFVFSDGVKLTDECIAAITTAMHRFNLDSACPLEPNHHRKYGLFESNQLSTRNRDGIELHEYCIAVKTELIKWFSILDAPLLKKKIVEQQWKHALVCNALIYAR